MQRFLLSLRRSLKLVRNRSTTNVILGIETSCDDTGAAVINTDGVILGEALNSQHLIHLRYLIDSVTREYTYISHYLGMEA